MVTPKILTRKCTECRDGMMEGELQAIPNEIPSSSYQKIVPVNIISTECIFVITVVI
jgi:hypothetical protein